MRVSENKLIVGYVENQNWLVGSLEVEINKRQVMVSTLPIVTRPGGKLFKIVSFYNIGGHIRSEIVCSGQTVLPYHLKHTASDFLG